MIIPQTEESYLKKKRLILEVYELQELKRDAYAY